jgi:hypothetical protein
MKSYFFFLLFLLGMINCSGAPESPFKQCLKNPKTCASIDIDSADANIAYKNGCDAKEFYACFRLGQFHEVKQSNLKEALIFYEKSCKGKDSFGCESFYEGTMRLCYILDDKNYCGKVEPKGEYRILALLENFDSKYKDAFLNHNFESPWKIEKARKIYEKLVKQKSKKLLEALEFTLKHSHHDGADAESLNDDISLIKNGKSIFD